MFILLPENLFRSNLVVLGKRGGWVETPEVEDAGDLTVTDVTSPVDVSADPSIGPATPVTPTAAVPAGSSHTKS